MQVFKKQDNLIKKYFKEISERKPFNVTQVLFLEIFMKNSMKTIFADPSLINLIYFIKCFKSIQKFQMVASWLGL